MEQLDLEIKYDVSVNTNKSVEFVKKTSQMTEVSLQVTPFSQTISLSAML